MDDRIRAVKLAESPADRTGKPGGCGTGGPWRAPRAIGVHARQLGRRGRPAGLTDFNLTADHGYTDVVGWLFRFETAEPTCGPAAR